MSFLFVCNFPPGRDENATVHLFAQQKGTYNGIVRAANRQGSALSSLSFCAKRYQGFSLVPFLFVCNFPPGRDENATVHLFAQHFPTFQIKTENPGTCVPGKRKLADNYGKRKSGRSHKDLPLYWRHHPDLNWGIKALQASALPLGYGAGKRMGTM